MSCEQVQESLGRYFDGELSAIDDDRIETHLRDCSICRCKLDELRELVAYVARPTEVGVPALLWGRIEERLASARLVDWQDAPNRRSRLFVPRWAIAAGLVMAVGLGMFGLSSLETNVQASAVDFGVLLDTLPLDPQKAFTKFLVRYNAKPITPIAARRVAPDLNFDTPPVLPGGFQLQSVYELRIGGADGIAAAYDRKGEFLAAVFHPPMKHENFGSHQNYPCVIGQHCGHKVQVGEWKLVHLTDATTCHCLLSRLDEQAEIPAVMASIASRLSEAGTAAEHHHPRQFGG